MNILSRIVIVSLIGGLSPLAVAKQVTIEFEGTISYVSDRYDHLNGLITPGTHFTGEYTYETTTPDSNDIPTVADYWHEIQDEHGIKVNIGGLTFETAPVSGAPLRFLVEIVNNHGNPASDNYLLRSYDNVPLDADTTVSHISWQLDDPTLQALDSVELSEYPPVLADWPSSFGLSINGGSDDFRGRYDYIIRGNVESIRVKPVNDSDGDGISDDMDNCTLVANPDQRDTNNDGFGNICDMDLNNDNVVDSMDQYLWSWAYVNSLSGNFNPDADFDGNGQIDTADIVMTADYFGMPPGPSGIAQ